MFPSRKFLRVHLEVHIWCQEVSHLVEYFSDWILCYFSWCLLEILSILVFKKFESHFSPSLRSLKMRNIELIPSPTRDSQSFLNSSLDICKIEVICVFFCSCSSRNLHYPWISLLVKPLVCLLSKLFTICLSFLKLCSPKILE